MRKKVLIVDDHPMVRHGIRVALESIGFQIIGETSDGADAVQLIESLKPNVVILDIGLEKVDGLTVLKRIVREKLETRVLVYTSQTKDTFASRCFQAGASGFVSKSEPMVQLLKAIETVADGYVLFPRDVMPFFSGTSVAGETGALENLTDREMHVMRLLAEGFSNRDIAQKLNLSTKTISGHKINILMKLNVTSVVELANIAKQHNLI